MAPQSIASRKGCFDMLYCILLIISIVWNYYPTSILGYQILPDMYLKSFNLNSLIDLHAWEHLKSLLK